MKNYMALEYNEYWKNSEITNDVPVHSPTLQYCVSEHSSFSPHLHVPASHVSVVPVHFAFDPHVHIFSWQVSESPEQSSLVLHSENNLDGVKNNDLYLNKLEDSGN